MYWPGIVFSISTAERRSLTGGTFHPRGRDRPALRHDALTAFLAPDAVNMAPDAE
jgi:hypothetical protein